VQVPHVPASAGRGLHGVAVGGIQPGSGPGIAPQLSVLVWGGMRRGNAASHVQSHDEPDERPDCHAQRGANQGTHFPSQRIAKCRSHGVNSLSDQDAERSADATSDGSSDGGADAGSHHAAADAEADPCPDDVPNGQAFPWTYQRSHSIPQCSSLGLADCFAVILSHQHPIGRSHSVSSAVSVADGLSLLL